MSIAPSTIVLVTQPWDVIELPFRSSSSIPIVVYNLARQLARRHRVVICCGRRRGQPAVEQDDAGVAVHRLPVRSRPVYQVLDRVMSSRDERPPLFCSPRYYPRFFARAAARARDVGADIVHVTTFFQHLSRFRAAVPDARLVLHMHAEMLSLVDERTAAGANDADLVLCCSQFLVDRIAEHRPVLSARCRALPNGVDSARFCPSPEGATPPPEILYVGRLSPEKGIHVLLDAFRAVRRAVPDAVLELIGVPGLLPHAYHLGLTRDPVDLTLERFYGRGLVDRLGRRVVRRGKGYVDELRRGLDAGTAAGVRMRGALDHARLPEAYRSAALFAFPSVWNEPFGMPVAEALAAGLPVVASRGGGIPETVRDGETGVLVERGDADGLAAALVGLLGDRRRRDAMAGAGRAWVSSTLSWPRIGSRLETLYGECTAGRSRAG